MFSPEGHVSQLNAGTFAGTFTAVHGIVFRGWIRWIPLLVVWLFAAACVTLKTVFFDSLPEWVGLSFYLGLGWGVALTAIPIFRQRGFAYLAPLFYGGAAYSIGAFMEYMGWLIVIPGVVHAHEIWHLAVLAGAGEDAARVLERLSLTPAQAFGEEAIRYSLLIVTSVCLPWAAWHYYRAGRTIDADLARASEQD